MPFQSAVVPKRSGYFGLEPLVLSSGESTPTHRSLVSDSLEIPIISAPKRMLDIIMGTVPMAPDIPFAGRHGLDLGGAEGNIMLIAEATAKIQATILTFRARASEGLGEINASLAVTDESLKAAEDRVRRTTLRSPVNGIVNKLVVNTIGAVVRPGESIVEIVPVEDNLLVEARVRPQDVAFIHPGQAASVKVTAYNYTVYGDLPGVVVRIGADTIPDEKGNPYYRVILRTSSNHLGSDKDPLPIIPGMVVTADIKTGRKSVMDYMLQPIQVARHEALRER